jgi:hypothetical protein
MKATTRTAHARAVTYEEAGRILSLAPRTVRQLVARGKVKAVRYDERSEPRIPMSEMVRLTMVRSSFSPSLRGPEIAQPRGSRRHRANRHARASG